MRYIRLLSGAAAAGVVCAAAPVALGDTLNLYAPGSEGSLNGALFQQTSVQPAGTGFIDPFVRIQRTGQSTGFEHGYNTDGQEEFDSKEFGGHNWNHSIQIRDIGAVTIGGTEYLQFWLDINEPNAQGSHQKNLLDLVELQVYLSDKPDNTGHPNLGSKVFDLDVGANGDSTVGLDGDLAPGSGKYDLIANIRRDLFAGPDTQYVYLYSAFGNADNLPGGEQGGFEEWAHRKAAAPVTVVPVPAAAWGGMALLGGLGAARRLRRRKDVAGGLG